jgi:hypothetical protein
MIDFLPDPVLRGGKEPPGTETTDVRIVERRDGRE